MEEELEPEGPSIPVPAPAAAPQMAPADSEITQDPMISKVIGGCQITERIARGGMGVVYKARQLNLGRTVAIKILSDELSRNPAYVERFLQEARSAAFLNHGNIIHINDVGEHNGIYFFIMEFVDGKNVREILKKKNALEVPQALQVALQVSRALQHAHRRGIIHRDIKPENIMITREGVVKLADLGLAKRLDSSGGITQAGSVLGTPFYMAPEQAKDFSKVDQRSDIYSLGVTLFKSLTGKVPFDGRTPIEVMIKAIEGKRQALRDLRPDLPPPVEALVDRMMARNPEDRFQQADDVIAAIEALLRTPKEGFGPGAQVPQHQAETENA
jgi:serine/threonine-protein kinase